MIANARRYMFPSLAQLRAAAARAAMPGLLDEPAMVVPDPELLKAAREEGRAQGHAQGRQEGMAEGALQAQACIEQELDALSVPLEALIAGFSTLHEQHRDALRQQLLPLLGQVARQVIRAELDQHPERMLVFVEEALATLPAVADEVEVRLNPAEYQRIVALAPKQAKRWRLTPDERLEQGECRIRAGARELDAGCGQRLSSCIEQLRGQIFFSKEAM